MVAIAVGVVAAAALVTAALLLRNDDEGPTGSTTPVVELEGIPQGGAVLGSPEAKVTLIEYADPQCPGCRYYTEQVFPTVVNEYVRPGKVKTEFRGFPFIGDDSVKALRFMLAAGLQDRLWQLQEALYRNQGAENSGWVTDDLVRGLAGDIPGLDIERLFVDAEREEITEEAEQASGRAEAAGIPGTPSFLVRIGEAEPYEIEVTPSTLNAAYFRTVLDDALRG
jgi:protein-disulfide isomerase